MDIKEKDPYIAARIQAIEKELQNLRHHVQAIGQEQEVRIEGLWKGTDIMEQDLDEAKKSLFKPAYKP